jgi:FMN phosphatase YigB (HAD superfamily)
MTPTPPPRAVFLDWAETLSHSMFWSRWREECPRDWETVQTRIFADPSLVHAWMRGRLTAEDVVARIHPESPARRAVWLRELERSCREMRLADESLRPLLARIRAGGTRVVIATDNMDTFPRWTVPALGLRDAVDDILDSWTLGVLKGDTDTSGRSAFFAPWLRANGIAPSETILFDDDPVARSADIPRVPISSANPLAAALRAAFPDAC